MKVRNHEGGKQRGNSKKQTAELGIYRAGGAGGGASAGEFDKRESFPVWAVPLPIEPCLRSAAVTGNRMQPPQNGLPDMCNRLFCCVRGYDVSGVSAGAFLLWLSLAGNISAKYRRNCRHVLYRSASAA